MNRLEKRRGRLEVREVARELVRSLRPAYAKLKTRDPDLARQLKKAGSSVTLNVGEGSRRRGRDRLYHFRVSAGSADEVLEVLLTAQAWGDLALEEVEASLALADRVLAMLWRLTEGRAAASG